MGALQTLVALLVLLMLTAPAQFVFVERIRLPFDREQSFSVNSSIEYILDFVPRDDEGAWPTRLWLRSTGGEPEQPLLLTARQRSGALSWQLPYLSATERSTLREITRTLCYDANTVNVVGSPDCEEEGAGAVRGAFSLHVSTACRSNVLLEVRATPLRDWRLPFQSEYRFAIDQTSPRSHLYEFLEGQDHVRLLIASDDDTCATVSVQNNSCPVGESAAEVSRRGLRMTVMRSGAVQLARSQFPRGFFVVALLEETDEACSGEAEPLREPAPEWLWEAAHLAEGAVARVALQSRRKYFTVTVSAALTRAQYAVASVAALLVFLAVYAAFVALVLAQRLAPCAPLVAPKAVLADAAKIENDADSETDADAAANVSSPRRLRRRDSNATLDGSDDSNSDEEPPAARVDAGAAARSADGGAEREQVGGGRREPDPTDTPFGLPARLNVAALARRRARTLSARSARYLSTLYTVAVFYALPVTQFVVTFQIVLNVSGSLDLCYYNFLCAHPAGALSDFNHVFSNLGYVLLGVLFVVQVRRRRARRRRRPRHEEYGIPERYGMLESLGAGIVVVGVLSAVYHVCPNRLNFQFDTAFMYVLMVLSMVTIYQSRHPDVNARAHATFGVLAVLFALVVWGVLGGGALFWAAFTLLHVFAILLLSLHVYYVGQFTLDKRGLAEATRGMRDLPSGGRPLYAARLAMLLVVNAVNWAFAVYGMVTMTTDFAGHLLYVLLCNTFMYMTFYLVMKLLHGERLRWYAWVFLGSAVATWVPALYFFKYGSSSWSSTPAASRNLNHECKVLRFYDAHDLWHFLSAAALYLSFNALLTWDDGLTAIKRTEIAVF